VLAVINRIKASKMNKLNQIIAAALISISLNSFSADCPSLSGNFSIGKSEGADFASITDAVNALQCGGVNGPVTFKIENGIYNERVVMSVIPGASAYNNITFESKSGVNTDAVIGFPTTDATLTMNGTSYVSFENISINHSAATYGNAVRVDGKATSVHFTGVIFDGVEVARTGANSATVYFTSNAPKYDIAFENCEINNGSMGIVKGGVNADIRDTKTSISGTLFSNQFETALALSNENAPAINNNVISSLSKFSNFKGISLNNITNELVLDNNVINMATGSTGIEMNNCAALPTHLGQVNGNSVEVGGKDEANGIALTGTTDNQVLNFNRIKLSNGTETVKQAYYRNAGSGNNINMLNNIFYDFSTGGYTIIGNSYKDMFNQLPGQSNPTLAVSANGLMIEKATPLYK
jgi:hypothetical protein